MINNQFVIAGIILLIITIIFLLIPSISPSKSYGSSAKEGFKTTWKFVKNADYSRGLWIFSVIWYILTYPFRLKRRYKVATYDDSINIATSDYISSAQQGQWKYEYASNCGQYKIGDEYDGVLIEFSLTPTYQDDGTLILYIHSPHMPEWYDQRYYTPVYGYRNPMPTH